MEIVIFQVGQCLYGIDAEAVREVVDPVPVTALPFVSAEVDGLINAAGRIVLQIDAARRLNVPMPYQEEGVVLIVATGQSECACRISRIITRATIETKNISYVAASEFVVSDQLLTGEFSWNDSLVTVLEPRYLLREQPMKKNRDEERVTLLPGTISHVLLQPSAIHAPDFLCIVFSCHNELFALRSGDVAEVVESGDLIPLSENFGGLPGVMLLRGAPLPVVSMLSLFFDRYGDDGEPLPFTLVVSANDCRVGLQVDRIVGMKRFACESLLRIGGNQDVLEGLVTTQDGTQVVLVRPASAVMKYWAAAHSI